MDINDDQKFRVMKKKKKRYEEENDMLLYDQEVSNENISKYSTIPIKTSPKKMEETVMIDRPKKKSKKLKTLEHINSGEDKVEEENRNKKTGKSHRDRIISIESSFSESSFISNDVICIEDEPEKMKDSRKKKDEDDLIDIEVKKKKKKSRERLNDQMNNSDSVDDKLQGTKEHTYGSPKKKSKKYEISENSDLGEDTSIHIDIEQINHKKKKRVKYETPNEELVKGNESNDSITIVDEFTAGENESPDKKKLKKLGSCENMCIDEVDLDNEVRSTFSDTTNVEYGDNGKKNDDRSPKKKKRKHKTENIKCEDLSEFFSEFLLAPDSSQNIGETLDQTGDMSGRISPGCSPESTEAILTNKEKKSKKRKYEDLNDSYTSDTPVKKKKIKEERNSSPNENCEDINPPITSREIEDVNEDCDLFEETFQPKGIENEDKKDGISIKEINSGTEIENDPVQIYIQKLHEMEFEVPFSLPLIHKIVPYTSTSPTEEQKCHLRNAGIKLKSGKYTADEDKKIRKNWKKFCRHHNLDKEITQPFLKRKLLPRNHFAKFLQFLSHNFYDRTMKFIHARFVRMYSNTATTNFTPEEDQIILDYMKNSDSKNPYLDLSLKLNRTRFGICIRYRKLKDELRENPEVISWDRYLSRQFLLILMEVTKSKSIWDLKGRHITVEEWKKVAQKIKIPFEKLRNRWQSIFYTKIFCSDYDNEMVRVKTDLLERFSRKYKDWREINWNKEAERFDAFTGIHLNKVFSDMLYNNVDKDMKKNFGACIDYLKEHYRKNPEFLKSTRRSKYTFLQDVVNQIELERQEMSSEEN